MLVCRFFRQFVILFAVHLSSLSMFRFLASVFQTNNASMTAASFALLFLVVFGGFVINKCKVNSFCQSHYKRLNWKDKLRCAVDCSFYACLVEVGFLGFSPDIWRDRPFCKWISCPKMAEGECLMTWTIGSLSIVWQIVRCGHLCN